MGPLTFGQQGLGPLKSPRGASRTYWAYTLTAHRAQSYPSHTPPTQNEAQINFEPFLGARGVPGRGGIGFYEPVLCFSFPLLLMAESQARNANRRSRTSLILCDLEQNVLKGVAP